MKVTVAIACVMLLSTGCADRTNSEEFDPNHAQPELFVDFVTYVEKPYAYELLLKNGHTMTDVDGVLSKQLAGSGLTSVAANVLSTSDDGLVIKVMRKPMRTVAPGNDLMREIHIDPKSLEVVRSRVGP